MQKIKFLILISSYLLCSGCKNLPKERPAEFGFVLKYGMLEPKNVIDTFEGTITKDLIDDGDTTVSFRFSNLQLDSIYKKVIEFDYFEYPDDYEPKGITALPYSKTRLLIKVGTKTKELNWLGVLEKDSEDSKRLGVLTEYIVKMVESSSEYKMLPEAKGGYY